MPCCGARTSLHDLDYAWTMGFAERWLSVEQPGPDWEPEPLRAEAEAILGVPLRLVIAHI